MDPAQPFKEQFIEADKKWGDLGVWQTIKLFSGNYTSGYLLNALDLQLTPDGIAVKPPAERIYIKLFLRTVVMSLAITGCCLLLGYPIAHLLASLPLRTSNLLLILVLLPFWTSLLVRTASWKVLLQQQGVINDLLVWTGIIDDAERLVMINNATGTIIAMTHILLPFMILPLFSVMKTIPPTYLRAAKSLGANDWTAFWRVYFPQTIPGIGAGAILVLHPLDRLLHHPRARRRHLRHLHLEPDRLPHLLVAQLGPRRRAGDAAPDGGAGPLLHLRPHRRHRQRQARVGSDGASPLCLDRPARRGSGPSAPSAC